MYSITSLLLLGACGKKTESQNSSTNVQNTEASGNTLPEDLKLDWRINTPEGSDQSISSLEVLYNGKVIYTDKMAGDSKLLSSDRYASLKIPADAVSAFSWVRAGFEHALYIAKENNMLVVYTRNVRVDDTDISYTKRKEIKASELK